MRLTPYHARYYALELRRRGLADGVEAVGSALFDARVDLNPHQIEAALFALQPLRDPAARDNGRLLADEVGLGKTIEAGLVICQLWAERRRNLLVIAPAALRKQWCQELESKFGLPTRLLEGRRHEGSPFEIDAVGVCSYAFARNNLTRLVEVSWDLVVCDEAHRLRNAWQPDSKLARPLVDALRHHPRVFLTATPLQNTLMEMYGIVSALDEHAFADAATFKAQYMKGSPDLGDLRRRLAPIVHRTLRRDVLPYVRYTERRPLTQRFTSSKAEQRLYTEVSDFLARDELRALPGSQRGLATMVLRKLLASSSSAIASGLDTIRRRLEAQLAPEPGAPALATDFDDEGFDDAWLDELLDDGAKTDTGDRAAIREEVGELRRLSELARGIAVDQRMVALLAGLKTGLGELRSRGAAEKAVIFTESRVTQTRLREWLEANGYRGRVLCFNGGAGGDAERAVLDAWLARHPDAARPVSQGGNSRAANLRAAIVDAFERDAAVLIATEAGSEGLNLQFCSLVVNYDLPWNPQRVEQRIGRCHRYGQKHDGVVVNFLDDANAADRRVLELLTDKFQLFNGVFGASDDILGRVDGGAGFERRVNDIFATCRTPEAIQAGFDALRKELEDIIAAREEKARKALLDHFDADVHDRLKVQLDAASARLDRIGRLFWSLTGWALSEHAHFDDVKRAFDLERSPIPSVPLGRYELVSRAGNSVADAFVYRLAHPLGEHVVEAGAGAPVPPARLVFDASGTHPRVMAAEALRGRSGWLRLDRLVVRSMSLEEHLLFSATVDEGPTPDPETLEKLFSLPARVEQVPTSNGADAGVGPAADRVRSATLAAAAQRSEAELATARERLERWADDQIQAAEVDLREVRGQIRQLEREARKAPTLDQQHALQKRIAEAEARQRRARQHVFSVEDEVRAKRSALLDALEARLQQRTEIETVFTIAWAVE